jgi:hypothetical protein
VKPLTLPIQAECSADVNLTTAYRARPLGVLDSDLARTCAWPTTDCRMYGQHHVGDHRGQRLLSAARDVVQPFPKGFFQADTRLVPCKDDGVLDGC